MKKSLLFAAAALLGLAPQASAIEQLTRANCQEKIADGAYIALQCKDWNGGVNTFFNGAQLKSLHLTSAQIFKVDKKDGDTGFYLQRVSDGKYVGKGNAPSIVDTKEQATPFSVQGVSLTGPWSTKPESIDPATAPTIRFITDGTYLNANDEDKAPKWATGTGGFSGWYVFSFTQAEVDHIVAIDGDSYQPTAAFADFTDHKILNPEIGVTSIDPKDKAWFMIYNKNRDMYLKQDGKNLRFVNIADASSGFNAEGTAVDNAGFLFKVDPAQFTDFGTAYANVISGYGDYVQLDGTNSPQFKNGKASIVGAFPRSLSIENAAEEGADAMDKWLICDKHYPGKNSNDAYYANVTKDGEDYKFSGWQQVSNIDKSDPNNIFEFHQITLIEEGEQVVEYTVEFKFNGLHIETRKIQAVAGSTMTIGSPDFFTDVFTVTIPDDNTDPIVLTLENRVIPFMPSPTIEEAKWQFVRQHAGNHRNKYHVWYYNEGDVATKTHALTNIGADGYEDAELWAFVGNMEDGYRIYNKAAGFEKYLIQGSEGVEFGTAEGADEGKGRWLPYEAANSMEYYWTEYCCFKNTAGSGYINMQPTNSESTEFELKFYGAADAGSVCWFFAPCDLMLRKANDFAFAQREIPAHPNAPHVVTTVPEEAVGAVDLPDDEEFLTRGAQIVADANDDPYSLDNAKALMGLIAEYAVKVKLNAFDGNKWYRMLSPCYGKYLRTHHENTTIVGGPSYGDKHKDYHTIFKLDRSEKTDAQNRVLYTIYSQGMYFGKVSRNESENSLAQVESIDDAGLFGPFDADDDPAIYAFGEYSEDLSSESNLKIYLHLNGSNGLQTWVKDAAGSHFLLMPANDLDFALDRTINGKNVGFGYFPFAVSAATEGTTLHFVHEGENGTLITSDATVVPANTAFLAVNADNTEVTLSIVTETPAAAPAARVQARTDAEKVMAGTLRPGTAAVGDYVIGEMSDGGLGFVKATSEAQVAGNSAYIPAEKLSDAAKANDELPLSDPTTTGVSEIRIEKVDTSVLYDLSGRRVNSPKSGIYVTANGKKIVL